MIFLVGILLILATSTGAAASPVELQRATIEADVLRNALDGSGHFVCHVTGDAAAGDDHRLWVTFGEVGPTPEGSWEAVGAAGRCGEGTFAAVAPGFTRVIGTPYLILDLALAPSFRATGEVELRTSVEIQKLSGFDEGGEPVYDRSAHERLLGYETEGQLILPLLVPDRREREAFGLHEVLVRLRAGTLPQSPTTAYGTIAVTADVPAADILLDGGVVGRTSEGSPTLVGNVPAGKREIRVRDLSGREALKSVVVKKGRTAEVAVDLLHLSSQETRKDLVPIGGNPQGHAEYWRHRDGAIVVKVPAGEFLMGSPEGVGQPQERPQHRVHVPEFLIDKTEVTWRQFRKFAEATGTPLQPPPLWGAPDDYPASSIPWEEAKAYCEWVGGRLPTEAEWEKAARGTDARAYPWGDQWDPDRCNSWKGGPNRPVAVGSFADCISPYGLLDMAGNMWEWCADLFDEDYYAQSPPRDPQGPSSGSHRVLRGGDWIAQPLWLRTADRRGMAPSNRNHNTGFRCVRDTGDGQ
jgi:formylglycine-generating enzyme required for sulfatase activity